MDTRGHNPWPNDACILFKHKYSVQRENRGEGSTSQDNCLGYRSNKEAKAATLTWGKIYPSPDRRAHPASLTEDKRLPGALEKGVWEGQWAQ